MIEMKKVQRTFIIENEHLQWLEEKAMAEDSNPSEVLRNILNVSIEQQTIPISFTVDEQTFFEFKEFMKRIGASNYTECIEKIVEVSKQRRKS